MRQDLVIYSETHYCTVRLDSPGAGTSEVQAIMNNRTVPLELNGGMGHLKIHAHDSHIVMLVVVWIDLSSQVFQQRLGELVYCICESIIWNACEGL